MFLIKNVIKDPHWYAVKVSDTTMLNRRSTAGYQKIIFENNYLYSI